MNMIQHIPITTTNFVVEFDSNWVLLNDAATILIEYAAEVTGDQLNADPFRNNATLTYTNGKTVVKEKNM